MHAVRTLLMWCGRDPADEAVIDTPRRVVDSLHELTAGYTHDPSQILERRFAIDHDELVLLEDIRFTSLCEHHMLPFTGQAAVAYLPGPDLKVVGISKLARIVECYARRLQVQERMSQQIATALVQHLGAKGVAVIIRAHHECMGCRGVRQPTARMVTSTMRGVFREDSAARNEVMLLLGG